MPAIASFLAPLTEQSYEHEQGRKLLADIEYVISFVNMQRFKDRLLVQVLVHAPKSTGAPGGHQYCDPVPCTTQSEVLARGRAAAATTASEGGYSSKGVEGCSSSDKWRLAHNACKTVHVTCSRSQA